MRKMNDRWAIIGRGKVGWHAKSADGLTTSSGGDPEPGWNGFRDVPAGGTYAEEAIAGALVYDADKADFGEFARLVIAGPMVNPSVPDGMVERALTYPRQLEPITAENPPRSLDCIGIAAYRERLAAVPGMRLGRVVNRRIIWEG